MTAFLDLPIDVLDVIEIFIIEIDIKTDYFKIWKNRTITLLNNFDKSKRSKIMAKYIQKVSNFYYDDRKINIFIPDDGIRTFKQKIKADYFGNGDNNIIDFIDYDDMVESVKDLSLYCDTVKDLIENAEQYRIITDYYEDTINIRSLFYKSFDYFLYDAEQIYNS